MTRVGISMLVAVLLSLPSSERASQQQRSQICDSSAACAQMALEAIEREEYERAHDLAWRAVQTGAKNDVTLLYLLSRTQSLSGRADDALVMLQRLATLGFRAPDIETSEDFRRVRALDAWTRVVAAIHRTEGGLTPGAITAPAPAAAAKATARKTLGVPASIVTPIALAYDAVSARFILADDDSNTLKVLDELAGNAVDLVARDWIAPYRSTAIAIDSHRGDLWAAGVDVNASGAAKSVLYKLQLVSGRRLQTIPFPANAGSVQVVDIAIGRDNVFVLDAVGGRIFALAGGASKPRLVVKLRAVNSPVSFALARDGVFYVAAGDGIFRVDPKSRRSRRVAIAKGVDVAGVQSIAWQAGSLVAVQKGADNDRVAVRIKLDPSGTVATAREIVEPAASRALTTTGDAFYYLGKDAATSSVVVRQISSGAR